MGAREKKKRKKKKNTLTEKRKNDNHIGCSWSAEREVLTLAFRLLCVSFTPPGSRQHRDNSPPCPHMILIFWYALIVKKIPPKYQKKKKNTPKLLHPKKCCYQSNSFALHQTVETTKNKQTQHLLKLESETWILRTFSDFFGTFRILWLLCVSSFLSSWHAGLVRHRGELRAAPSPLDSRLPICHTALWKGLTLGKAVPFETMRWLQARGGSARGLRARAHTQDRTKTLKCVWDYRYLLLCSAKV